MHFRVRSELDYQVNDDCTLILAVEAAAAEGQKVIEETFTASPGMATGQTWTAAESGNRYRRLRLGPGSYRFRYEALVDVVPLYADPESVPEVPVADLPPETLPQLYPSRFCQSDRLARFALRRFGTLPRGHERVSAICNWIRTNVDYLVGASTPMTSAYDTFSLRAGVCRDFAHLGITFCRALGIPARFVSCYSWQLSPQDYHAVFEAYLGGRWYLFDATRSAPLDGLIRIAVGRDAADSAFATYFGAMTPTGMAISVTRDANLGIAEQWTTKAVSVSGV